MRQAVTKAPQTCTDHAVATANGPATTSPRPARGGPRPVADGKFLAVGTERLWVRGVTYGTFAPGADGDQFGTAEQIDADLAAMAASGINALRTYTVPSAELLDAALRHGLWVMAGLPWEQHVAFLDDRGRADAIEAHVREGVRSCAGHPALMCFTVGNEIPAGIVRWHGHRRVERFLDRLCRAVRDEDPGAQVTYVSFPSTEYLRVREADIVAFNVYLEDREELTAYLARLQTLAGERPLLMAEIGLDSRRNGLDVQADALAWQVAAAFSSGCAGAFVFAWTDEWHRGGDEIEDWDFGLTGRDRRPKPALAATAQAFAAAPFAVDGTWPSVSVAVCTYNGAATLGECLEGLSRLTYPDVEVIVVDDGSTDASAEIASSYDVRLISTENQGLSAARTTAMRAATGEVLAYSDDDARPTPTGWLPRATLRSIDHAGAAGRTSPVPGTGSSPRASPTPRAAAARPARRHGRRAHPGLQHGLLARPPRGDRRLRRAVPRRGDDVDVCWRLQERGWTLGFHPSAVVWHHRRGSLRRFWRQQRGYGHAEALLERKWPVKYNTPGTRCGRAAVRPRQRPGAAPVAHLLRHVGQRGLPVGAGSAGRSAADACIDARVAPARRRPRRHRRRRLDRSPLALAVVPLVLAFGLLLTAATLGAARSDTRAARRPSERIGLLSLTGLLFVLQPAARLAGRLAHGLSPWRRARLAGFRAPVTRTEALWFERWQSLNGRLAGLEAAVQASGARVRRGRAHSTAGTCRPGAGRVRRACACERRSRSHGRGHKLLRVRSWPPVARRSARSAPSVTALAVAVGSPQGAGAYAPPRWPSSRSPCLTRRECGIAGRQPRRGRLRRTPATSRSPARRTSDEICAPRRGASEARSWFLREYRTRLGSTCAAQGPCRDVDDLRLVLLGSVMGPARAPGRLASIVDVGARRTSRCPRMLGLAGGLPGRYDLLASPVRRRPRRLGPHRHGLAVVDEYVNTKLDQASVLDLRSQMMRTPSGLSLGLPRHEEDRPADVPDQQPGGRPWARSPVAVRRSCAARLTLNRHVRDRREDRARPSR
jgi:hypothetical protein